MITLSSCPAGMETETRTIVRDIEKGRGEAEITIERDQNQGWAFSDCTTEALKGNGCVCYTKWCRHKG
ncbi:hypothetical protein Hanom_Chr10g00906101 [Helianthus anomalus]